MTTPARQSLADMLATNPTAADLPPDLYRALRRAELLYEYPRTAPSLLVGVDSVTEAGEPLVTEYRAVLYTPDEDADPEGVIVDDGRSPARVYPLADIGNTRLWFGDSGYEAMPDLPDHVHDELRAAGGMSSFGWPLDLSVQRDSLWRVAARLYDLDMAVRTQHGTVMFVPANAGTNLAWHVAEAFRRVDTTPPWSLLPELLACDPAPQIAAEDVNVILFAVLRGLGATHRETERLAAAVVDRLDVAER